MLPLFNNSWPWVSFKMWYLLDVFVKCIGGIANVCVICDVVYHVDAFLTSSCENTKFLIRNTKLIGKREDEIFTEDIYDKTHCTIHT